MVHGLYILSQTQPAASPRGGATLMIGLMLAMGVFFFMTSRSQKRERTQKAEMLSSLSKNDRVMTIGGVIGTVVGVKENEITLKVDEATNTRMTFTKRSIQQVVTSDADLKQD